MFHDRLTVTVRAGRGGDGSASFRREAHVPRGGADGGDGGDGGDVVLLADASLRDLASLRRKRKFAAGNGGNGAGKRRHGKRGDDLVIHVPPGTQAYTEDGSKLCDLTEAGASAVIARGGGGGRGNTHFVSSVRRAPAFCEIGLPGEELGLELRLKLIVDAALVGLPNAGKSSLLRKLSAAKPKIGAYPFTTLVPVLGTLDRPDGSQMVIVDVPGLIEGASEGHGLGDEFLPHLERAYLLIHLVSLEDVEVAAKNYRTVVNELWKYDPHIAQLPQVLVLSKVDIASEDDVERVERELRVVADEISATHGPLLALHAVSSITGAGISDLVNTLYREASLREMAPAPGPLHAPTLEDYRVYRPQPRRRRWRIFRDAEGFRVEGEPAVRALAERAGREPATLPELFAWLTSSGAARALAMAGASAESNVVVCGVPVEWEVQNT